MSDIYHINALIKNKCDKFYIRGCQLQIFTLLWQNQIDSAVLCSVLPVLYIKNNGNSK